MIACGGRDFADRQAVYDALDALRRERKITVVVSRAARAARSLRRWIGQLPRASAREVFVGDWKRNRRGVGRSATRRWRRRARDLCVPSPDGSKHGGT